MSPPSDRPRERQLADEPVRRLDSELDENGELLESARRKVEDGIALCLSGGGYRAMLFHAGALWRLNELGYLPRLDRVSSVSGGSITAAALAVAWDDLDFDSEGRAQGLEALVVEPLMCMARKRVDIRAISTGLLWGSLISQRLESFYDRHLLRGATLQDLPEKPMFIFNSTNLESGVLWRFSRPYMRDYRVGGIEHPTIPLATAVAASSAFPPILSPRRLKLDPNQYMEEEADEEEKGLTADVYRRTPTLTDGGVYDNLGLEAAYKRYRTLLVSDAGGAASAQPRVPTDAVRQTRRVLAVIDSQVRSLRKRHLIGAYKRRERHGAYWSIRSDPSRYPLSSERRLEVDHEAALELAAIRTRLVTMPGRDQEALVNWGYAICDTAMRSWVEKGESKPSHLPFPATGVVAPKQRGRLKSWLGID